MKPITSNEGAEKVNAFGYTPCPQCKDECRFPSKRTYLNGVPTDHASAQLVCDACGFYEKLPDETEGTP